MNSYRFPQISVFIIIVKNCDCMFLCLKIFESVSPSEVIF